MLAGAVVGAEPAAGRPVVIDTDFTAASPSDDALAVLLALQSPELDVVGITTVAGNDSLERATSDVLRVLEIAGRPDVPVYAGANMPLVHEAGPWERAQYGRWYSDDPPPPPPGGFARKKAQKDPGQRVNMFDEVAVASLIDATLVQTREMYVDVDIHPGINYGVSVGGDETWPGAEGARRMAIQHDLDWERFARLFVARLTTRRPPPETP